MCAVVTPPVSPSCVRSTAPGRSSTGFTLAEIVVVLVILGVAAGAVVPALLEKSGPEDPAVQTAEHLATLLRSARHRAVSGGEATVLVLDAGNGRYWLEGDSVQSGVVTRGPGVTLSATASRVRFEFSSTGVAWGEPVIVSGAGRVATVRLDPWTGEAGVQTR